MLVKPTKNPSKTRHKCLHVFANNYNNQLTSVQKKAETLYTIKHLFPLTLGVVFIHTVHKKSVAIIVNKLS